MTYCDNLLPNVKDTTDIETLYILIGIEWKKGKTNAQIREKLDCPMRTVEEAIVHHKKLYK
jgi:hypothetical protein